jgi:hypothetical protein
MNFADYGKEFAETWADVKPYLDSQDASVNRPLSIAIGETCAFFKDANDAWNRVISPPDYDLEASEAGHRLEWHKLLRKHKNEWIRQFSWEMAVAAIAKVEAVMGGDAAKVAIAQDQIEKAKTDLKTELGKVEQEYSKY